MNLADVTKRLEGFENQLTHLRLEEVITREVRVKSDISLWLERLRDLAQDTHRIMLKAECTGDYRTAVAAVHELSGIFQLEAKLSGELQEKEPMNIVNVQLDADTAVRIARTYLARHRTVESQ